MEKARGITKGFIKQILKLLRKPEMRILPGQLAFFLVMSIIPITALVGVIATTLSIPLDYLKLTINSSVPKEIAEVLNPIVSGQGISFNIIIFLISAFLLASNGPHSMIITSNEIYKIKSDNFIRRRFKAIGMTFSLVGLFIFLFIVPVCGDTIFMLIKYYYKNKTVIDLIYNVYQLIKYPIIIIIIYFNIKMIYVIAPDKKIESMSTTKGAIFTTIGWIIATEIFSLYIGKFNSYDIFYGSISNILILLLWLYILSYIFVLGMIINAGSFKLSELEEKSDKETQNI